MAFSAATFLSDTVLFIRDDLRTNLTDPINGTRKTGSNFVMTSYPQREVDYPLITVKHNGSSQIRRLGLRSEGVLFRLPMEIRVWARNIKEKDNLSEQVVTQLRTNQFGSGSTSEFELHDFKINSMIDVDEPGDKGIKSKVIEVEYIAIVDS